MSSFLRPLSLLSKLENEKKKSETTSNRRSFDQVCNFRQHHVKKTKDAVKHILGRDSVSLTTMFTFSRERERHIGNVFIEKTSERKIRTLDELRRLPPMSYLSVAFSSTVKVVKDCFSSRRETCGHRRVRTNCLGDAKCDERQIQLHEC